MRIGKLWDGGYIYFILKSGVIEDKYDRFKKFFFNIYRFYIFLVFLRVNLRVFGILV